MKIAIIGAEKNRPAIFGEFLLKKQRPQADNHGLPSATAPTTRLGSACVFPTPPGQFREIRSPTIAASPGVRLLGRHRRALPGTVHRVGATVLRPARGACCSRSCRSARGNTHHFGCSKPRSMKSAVSPTPTWWCWPRHHSRFASDRRALRAGIDLALQQVRLDGLHKSRGRLHLHLPETSGDRSSHMPPKYEAAARPGSSRLTRHL